MSGEPRFAFRRVLLKLGGEALSRPGQTGYDLEAARRLARRLGELRAGGLDLAVVLGAGNLWRGAGVAGELPRPAADAMGMLGTVMNGLCLEALCQAAGVPTVLFTAFPVGSFAPLYRRSEALAALDRRDIVLLAGGTGHPYFTTDTTAVLRAAELEAELLVKATKVEGVYDRDPSREAGAVRLASLDYDTVLDRRLAVMDAAAAALAREAGLTTVVVSLWEPEALEAVLAGDRSRGSWIEPGGDRS